MPHKPRLGVSCFWRLLVFAVWPGGKPFRGAEKPPIAFICQLKKQVRVGLVRCCEGEPAISERAGVGDGHLTSSADANRLEAICQGSSNA